MMRNEQGVSAQYIPRVREWLQQDNEGIFVGVSLSILNGGMFNDDDLPIQCRSVLNGEYEVALSYGRNWESFYHISVILDLDPYAPYTLAIPQQMAIPLMKIIHYLIMNRVV